MTIKEKKEFLKSYKVINSEIDRLLSECERYREIATKITPTYSDMPSLHNNNSKIVTAVEKINELENKINEKIDVLISKRDQIEKAISTINNSVLEEVLKRRYINLETWEQIAVDMNYTYQWINKLHLKSLQEIEL